MNPREIILSTLRQVLDNKGDAKKTISGRSVMGPGGLGLDSLDMATLVSMLDAKLKKDPFANGAASFKTVEDFIRLYEENPR